ncbi:ABC transporter ATP-binding protein [Galactobacter valiniphilus]|uniref:ABC transporter ATP-binding protein n=1 Tax=Galactobacter valiniphilus TaxID=2676122 RepID=UPI001F40E0FE|nr:ABC transporter ATP-binding protein [Galactobacter valiniphilus]
MNAPIVHARGLRVAFDGVEVVRGIDLSIAPGTCLALVGESGSGKSVTARALVGLTGGSVSAEELRVVGADALSLSERAWRSVRGRRVGTVLQDALGSLDPLRPVGREVADAARLAGVPLDLPALLRSVGLDPAAASRRPDELSGGMRQRALIAAALAADPELVIADEPTTALDTTRQAVVLSLLRARVEAGGALLFITHDLAAARRVADEVAIMDDGRIVERGPVGSVLAAPMSAEGRRLVASVPWERPRGERLLPDDAVPGVGAAARLAGGDAERPVGAAPANGEPGGGEHRPGEAGHPAGPAAVVPSSGEAGGTPVLELREVTIRHRGADAPTVVGASLRLERGRTLGLVGESGSGKSTLLRAAAGLVPIEAGEVLLGGEAWSALPERRRRARRREQAMIVQDPLGSFEPRWSVGRILTDALGRRDASAVRGLLESVHLSAAVADAHPRTLSGGQRQRVAIARALAVEPSVLLCDEPVSALDASVQARVLDLLDELQEERGLAILLVSHDLGVIRHASDNLAVLDGGTIVESGPTEAVLAAPRHPFTRELIDAAPRLR